MNTQLIFKSYVLEVVKHEGKSWFTATTLAIALEYSDTRKVTHLYNRNSDEFTPGMSEVLKSSTSGNLQVSRRIFSLRGAHLIAMFASTPVAKEFRKWVLDLIDKELACELSAPQLPTAIDEKLPLGVYAHQSKYNPYRASVFLDRKNIHVGVFPTIQDAVLARHEYLRRHHVNRVIEGNLDIASPAGINARLLITVEHGQATRSKIMHPDAITATPDNLPDVLKSYGLGKISTQQYQKIIEACVSVIARKCENLQLAAK